MQKKNNTLTASALDRKVDNEKFDFLLFCGFEFGATKFPSEIEEDITVLRSCRKIRKTGLRTR
jgi:hypothetical protein